MNNSIETTVAFTGHRNITERNIAAFRARLDEAVQQAYDEGYRNFITGMALGFDMMAAEAVIRLRDEHDDVLLTAAVPFSGQELRWQQSSQDRYNQILDEADEVVYVSHDFFRGCEMKRNQWMIDHASRLIAYFNGEPHGGTYFTYHRAEEQDKPITNLYSNE